MADPFISNVTLLCHCNGTNGGTTFTDNSPQARPLTAAGAPLPTTSSTQAKFGATSCFIGAASGSYVDVGGALADFDFGSAPFTMEAWIYLTAINATCPVLARITVPGPNTSFWFGVSSGYSRFWYYSGGVQKDYFQTPSIGINAWRHLAVDSGGNGTTLRVYVDGVVITPTATMLPVDATTTSARMGNDQTNSVPFKGYIDEVRVTKGVQRYNGAFTPPTAPFDDPVVGGTTQVRVSILA
jgi:hypothetical protein